MDEITTQIPIKNGHVEVEKAYYIRRLNEESAKVSKHANNLTSIKEILEGKDKIVPVESRIDTLSAEEVFLGYPDALFSNSEIYAYYYGNEENSKIPLDKEHVSLFKKWIRLNNNFGYDFKPMTRDEFIDFAISQDNDEKRNYKTLLSTDIANQIPENISLLGNNSFNSLLLGLGLNNLIQYTENLRFAYFSNRIAVIPDLNTLSLFIEHGRELREYAKLSEDIPIEYLYITDRSKTDNYPRDIDYPKYENYEKPKVVRSPNASIFNNEGIACFAKEKGTAISYLFKEVQDLDADLRSNTTKAMFDRLVAYNPQLVKYVTMQKDT